MGICSHSIDSNKVRRAESEFLSVRLLGWKNRLKMLKLDAWYIKAWELKF
jgi:hypothetical protein